MGPMESPDTKELAAVAPERLNASTAHLRSPVVDDRSIELLSLDADRPTRGAAADSAELVGVLLWSLVPGVPLLALVGWQPAVAAAASCLLIRSLRRHASQSGSLFADGFLRFRGTRCAPGVQEEDDVRWRWRGGGDGRAGGWHPPVAARIDQPLTAPPVMPRTK